MNGKCRNSVTDAESPADGRRLVAIEDRRPAEDAKGDGNDRDGTEGVRNCYRADRNSVSPERNLSSGPEAGFDEAPGGKHRRIRCSEGQTVGNRGLDDTGEPPVARER